MQKNPRKHLVPPPPPLLPTCTREGEEEGTGLSHGGGCKTLCFLLGDIAREDSHTGFIYLIKQILHLCSVQS